MRIFLALLTAFLVAVTPEAPADACGVKLTVKAPRVKKRVDRSDNPSRILLLGEPPRTLAVSLSRAGHTVDVAEEPGQAQNKQYDLVVADPDKVDEARTSYPGAQVVTRTGSSDANVREVERVLAREGKGPRRIAWWHGVASRRSPRVWHGARRRWGRGASPRPRRRRGGSPGPRRRLRRRGHGSKDIERPEDSGFIGRHHFKGEIEFKDVSFAYPGENNPESLRNINLTIRPGEHVAIIGRIGSGKSTLLRMILGLYQPTNGAVRIDGVDIRQLDPAELRRNVGYVPQDVMLFYGSLRDNLTISCPAADDAAVLRAAEVGGILEFVNSHPRGFDMTVGERGESLSAGSARRWPSRAPPSTSRRSC